MANKVKSKWTATFDLGGPHELVLVDTDLYLESELELGGEQVVEDADYIEAEDSEPLAFGNVKREVTLTVYRRHATGEEARDFCLEHDIAMPTGVQADLTIAVDGGATFVFSPAVIRSWKTTPRRVGRHETATTYVLRCGALSLGSPGSPSGPEPVGLDAYALNLISNLQLLAAGDVPATHGAAVATWGNQGTGADAVQATATARPTVIAGVGTYHPGISGNFTQVLHAASLNVGTSFALRWDGVLPSYTPAARVCLLSKWQPTGNQRSYALYLEPNGRITLAVSTDGTAGTVTEWTSAAAVVLPAGTYAGIYAIKNGTALDFWLYRDSGWTRGIQIGATQTITNHNPFDGTADLLVGATAGGTADLMEGFTELFQVSVGTGGWFVDSTLLRLGSAAGTATASPPGWSGWTPVVRAGDRPGIEIGTSPRAFARHDGINDSLAVSPAVPLNAVAGATLAWLGRVNRVTGINDLIACAAPGSQPRAVLRVEGGDLKLLVRRLDGEATATITAVGAVAAYFFGTLGAVVDYAAGTATLYRGSSPLVTGSLTSAGTTTATNSPETRLMAGLGGANPAAGDVLGVAIGEEALDAFGYSDLVTAMVNQLV